MNWAIAVRIAFVMLLVVGAGIYCWRVGIRWSPKTTIRGMPAKIAAIFLFIVAGVMALSLCIPDQFAHHIDQLEQKISPQPQRPRVSPQSGSGQFGGTEPSTNQSEYLGLVIMHDEARDKDDSLMRWHEERQYRRDLEIWKFVDDY